MAYFAELDDDDIVLRVISVADTDCQDVNGVESETIGIAFCEALLGEDREWVQTSYNSNFRKNYAGPGFKYDRERNAFIAPKPFDSWLLNEDTCRWEAPWPKPDDGQEYYWDESVPDWSAVNT